MFRSAAPAIAIGLVLASQSLALAHEGHGQHADHEQHQDGAAAYGHPGRAQDVSRTITLIATEMQYSESTITVTAGDTIRFVLVNKGRQDHDLMIADTQEQLEHRQMMAAMKDSKQP